MALELAPTSVEESGEAMARCARDRLRVRFVGGGTAPPLAPPEVDAVLATRGMARVLEHAPADMVVIVEAGVTLAQLQQALGGHRQRLALDAPAPERATIGGLVATGAFGPRRARYGAIRDLIIGVALVRADGAIARGGGKVVKNVAGFDLPKLACGSLGTLGLIASATFRLHPLPEASATVVLAGLTAAEVVARIAALRDAQLEPACAVALRRADARFDLGLRFEGFGPGVEEQVTRAGGARVAPGEFWPRHDAIRAGGPWRVKVATLPTRLEAVRLGGAFAWYATLGIGFASGELSAREIEAARADLVAAGGSLIVEQAPDASVSPWGPPPPGFAVMQALKQRFDPERRLNPGIFVGGL
jgi:glycolate oxidase FAD binding subunit